MTRLSLRTARVAVPPRTLAESIDVVVDALLVYRAVAADERRPPARTEQLLDGLDQASQTLHQLARGRR